MNTPQTTPPVSRTRWNRKQLFALGKALDRLMLDSATRLIPTHELLMTYAQREALPMEERRTLTKAQALGVIKKIDDLRDEQEMSEWMGDSAAEDLLENDMTTLPTDSEEVKRSSALLTAFTKSEERILAKLEQMDKAIAAYSNRVDRLTAHLESIKLTPSEPATHAAKPTTLVVYPYAASWETSVVRAVKALRKKYALDRYAAKLTSLESLREKIKQGKYDKIVIVDAAGATFANCLSGYLDQFEDVPVINTLVLSNSREIQPSLERRLRDTFSAST